MKDFSRLQAVMYTVKVAVYRHKKWCKIDTLLLHTANRKHQISYRFMAVPITLNDLEGHLPIARLFKCN